MLLLETWIVLLMLELVAWDEVLVKLLGCALVAVSAGGRKNDDAANAPARRTMVIPAATTSDPSRPAIPADFLAIVRVSPLVRLRAGVLVAVARPRSTSCRSCPTLLSVICRTSPQGLWHRTA